MPVQILVNTTQDKNESRDLTVKYTCAFSMLLDMHLLNDVITHPQTPANISDNPFEGK